MSSSVYEWSQVLPVESQMKRAVDSLLCSICYLCPEFFTQILQWMGISASADQQSMPGSSPSASAVGRTTVAVTDDAKMSHPLMTNDEPVTDDVKAADGVATTLRNSVNALSEAQVWSTFL